MANPIKTINDAGESILNSSDPITGSNWDWLVNQSPQARSAIAAAASNSQYANAPLQGPTFNGKAVQPIQGYAGPTAPAAYAPPPTAAGATPATALNAATAQAGSPMDLNLQFAQTLAPLLQMIQQQQGNQWGRYSDSMNHILSTAHLPPGVADVYRANMAQQQQDSSMMNSMAAQAAATMPGWDALMNQLNQARNAQTKAYYQEKANEATSQAGLGLTAPVGTPVAGG